MRTRFSERPASQQRGWVFMAVIGMLGVLGVLGLTYVGYKAPDAIPGRSYYNLKARFTNADNLTGHYQVRDGGKLVGQVLNPRVADGQAEVDLQLDPSIRPLKSDTVLEVRPRSAVGVRYIDIIPGSRGAALTEGATIPATQTKSTVQLDEVLGTFDTATRRHTQQFLRELGTGFAGRGQDLGDTLGAAPAMLKDTGSVLGTIADRQGSVRGLIDGGSTLADAADPVRESIANGFAPEAAALRPFTAAGDAVHATLDKAPAALSTVSSGLPQVDPLVDQLNGLARDARPGLQVAPASLTQTSALLKESRPGLRAARATLATAAKAVSPTLALLAAVRPVLPDIDSTIGHLTPTLATLGAHGCDVVRFGDRWADMMKWGNQDGAILRVNVQAGPESVYGWTRKVTNIPTNAYPGPCEAGHEKVGG